MGQRVSGGIQNHQGLERFIASATDVAPKDHIDLMARCWFSLTPNRTEPIEHEFTDARTKLVERVRITGSIEHGIATIHDHDLVIFAVSQWIEAKRRGLEPSRRISFTPYQFFSWMGKAPSGQAYARLREALNRLRTTNIETTLRAAESNRRGRMRQFSWISEWELLEEDGGIRGVEVVLAEWLFESIQTFHVLTLDKRYFDIPGSVERWLYLYARKATGNRAGIWKESVKSLYKKSASQQAYKHYANTVRKLVEKNDLPGVRLGLMKTVQGHAMLVMARTGKPDAVEREPNPDRQPALIELSPLEEAWANVLVRMGQIFSDVTARSWLGKLTLLGLEAGLLRYHAPNDFIAAQIRSQFLPRLKEAWQTLGHDVEEIRIETAKRQLDGNLSKWISTQPG